MKTSKPETKTTEGAGRGIREKQAKGGVQKNLKVEGRKKRVKPTNMSSRRIGKEDKFRA